MHKKKIAFVLESMIVGGVERAVIELFKNIDYQKYEVFLFLGDDYGPLQRFIPENVHIEYYSAESSRELLKKQFRSFQWYSAVKGIVYRLKARKHIDEYNLNAHYCVKSLPLCSTQVFDCVIGYQVLSPTVVATALYRLRGKKRAIFVHGRNVRPMKLVPFYDKIYYRFDRIYCVSRKTQNDFVEMYPLSASKTDVMYNLYDIGRITKLADEKIDRKLHDCRAWSLVTVGRLEYVKGQGMIPKAARILLDKGYNVNWYVIGDGGNRGEIEKEIERNNVKHNVFLLGTLINPYPYIKNCDIYVQPSFSEGYCTTTVEAKILHKPVVTTDAPGMREQFVSGENGLIVDAMTPEAIAEGVRQLLDHPELMEKFTNALKNESIDNSAELQKLYDFIES